MTGIGDHGVFFLIGLAMFPLITLLLFSSTPFGLLAWIGWLFAPHLLVAVLALPYWDTHPILVMIAWAMALTGTLGEAGTARRVR